MSSASSVLLVAVRSQIVEANVVSEVWWETLRDMLLTFVNDAPTYVCSDVDGRLGSSSSKHVGSLSADQENTQQ